MPLPPAEGFPRSVVLSDPREPQFDPKIHLSLSRPEYVVTFPNMEKMEKAPKVTTNKGSSFAYSGPFQLLSEEGLRVVRDIVKREKHRYRKLLFFSTIIKYNFQKGLLGQLEDQKEL